MKSVSVFLALAALISLASGCLFYNPVCGRIRNTNTCQTFFNQCKYSLLGNREYEKVDMSYCNRNIGIAPCLITETPTTVIPPTTVLPPTTSWACGTVCTPLATKEVCTYQVNAQPDTCRKFRNQCELNNYKCEQTQPLFEVADPARCAALTGSTAGNCI